MDSKDLAKDFQHYILGMKTLKQENEDCETETRRLEMEIQETEKLLLNFEENEDLVNKFENVFIEQNENLDFLKAGTTSQEDLLEEIQTKYQILVADKTKYKEQHEEEKHKIKEGKKNEIETLIKQVGDFQNQIQRCISENTNLQLQLVASLNKYNTFKHDMELIEGSCVAMENEKKELRNKISKFQTNSSEELFRLDRHHRLRLVDLTKTEQKVQNLKKKLGQ